MSQSAPKPDELLRKCMQLRTDVLEMCVRADTGHVTSCFSCIETMVALYYGGLVNVDCNEPKAKDRTRFILSKGQASPLLYCILADLGFFPKEWLKTFAQKEGRFGVHLQNDIPGVEITSGALGHGLGVAAGMALSLKYDENPAEVVCLLGDGELYEGSIWESALFAAQAQLQNLTAIVDRNRMCTTDFTEKIIQLDSVEEKFQAFGWGVVRVADGHNVEEVLATLKTTMNTKEKMPKLVVVETVKGHGIESMSKVPLFHGVPPRGEQIAVAAKELNKFIEDKLRNLK